MCQPHRGQMRSKNNILQNIQKNKFTKVVLKVLKFALRFFSFAVDYLSLWWVILDDVSQWWRHRKNFMTSFDIVIYRQGNLRIVADSIDAKESDESWFHDKWVIMIHHESSLFYADWFGAKLGGALVSNVGQKSCRFKRVGNLGVGFANYFVNCLFPAWIGIAAFFDVDVELAKRRQSTFKKLIRYL